jgi:hypothetical protein
MAMSARKPLARTNEPQWSDFLPMTDTSPPIVNGLDSGHQRTAYALALQRPLLATGSLYCRRTRHPIRYG